MSSPIIGNRIWTMAVQVSDGDKNGVITREELEKVVADKDRPMSYGTLQAAVWVWHAFLSAESKSMTEDEFLKYVDHILNKATAWPSDANNNSYWNKLTGSQKMKFKGFIKEYMEKMKESDGGSIKKLDLSYLNKLINYKDSETIDYVKSIEESPESNSFEDLIKAYREKFPIPINK